MGTRIIKMPDVGEGVAEAEIVEWHVEVGQSVLEDQILAAVMTDKATVEIPSPVAGKVVALGGEVGSMLAVGAELVRLEVAGEGNEEVAAAPREAAPPAHPPAERLTTPPPAPKAPAPHAGRGAQRRSPADRWDRRGRPARSRSPRPRCAAARAMPASICARCAAAARPAASATTTSTPSCAAGRRLRRQAAAASRNTEVETVKVIGLRRRIAQKMAESKRRIAHFSYVEEVDVTALEELRAEAQCRERRTGRG